MAFPTSPSNGDKYLSPNGIEYVYVSANDAWVIVTAALPLGGRGFDWVNDNAVTTDQTPTTSDLYSRYLFTQATGAVRNLTLPSVGADENGKWIVVGNNSKYTITIIASDSDTIGWPALYITAIEILPNTQVTLRYNHATTKWDIAHKEGSQCRPSGAVLYLPFDTVDGMYYVGPSVTQNACFQDKTNQHLVYTALTATGSSAYSTTSNRVGFGNAVINLDGISGFLISADSADWDVFSSTANDCTICGWIYCDRVIGTTEILMSQYEDGNNAWVLRRNASGALAFFFDRVGNFDIDMTGGSIGQSVWIHVAMCKVGAETGIYVNGIQVAYDATFTTDTFAGSLYMGQLGSGVNYFDGRMDDWAIVYRNIFGAAPNSTPNDSFTLDTLAPLGLVI